MSPSKPSIIIVPGACGLPEFYDGVVDPVANKGFEIKALHIPTVGLKTGPREGPPPTIYDDAAFIAKEVKALADQGKDVILIAHSYGGVPTTQSTEGLSKAERKALGKEGGIVRLGYMTSLVPAVGEKAMELLMDVPPELRVNLIPDDKGWLHQDKDNIPKAARQSFSGIPQEEGEAWIRKMPCHSGVCFTNEVTYAGYKDIPVSYLICEEDLVIPLKNQKAGIEKIEKLSGKKVDVTSIKSDHIPPASHPQLVIDWILDVAGKV